MFLNSDTAMRVRERYGSLFVAAVRSLVKPSRICRLCDLLAFMQYIESTQNCWSSRVKYAYYVRRNVSSCGFALNLVMVFVEWCDPVSLARV